MRQERIAVADMLPDKHNPRTKFEGIKELADSFAITPGRPGEPFNPPIVVQDGTKYRIVEGHRRHKAMKRLKTETCLAIVADDFDEANTLAVMLATDEKQKLTDVEKSKGVQTMLMTGVDPVTVEKAAYLPKGSAKKIKTAMIAAGDAAEQMSMERLFALAEFDGDEDAVEAIASCGEDGWRDAVSEIKRKRKYDEGKAALVASLEKHGVEVVEDHPSGMLYGGQFGDVDAMEEWFAENGCEGARAYLYKYSAHPCFEIYLPAAEKEVDPEEERRKAERDRHVAAYQQGAQRRLKWVAGKVARPSEELPHIAEEVEADEERFDWQWTNVFKYVGDEADVPAGPSEIIWYVWGMERVGWGLLDYSDNVTLKLDACSDYVHLIDLLKSDGYESDESETAMYEAAKNELEAEDLEA